mgnify:CR=1 FL=1|jgi:dTDP-4-dehydrorhamnose 3,5-epimerase
MKNFKELKIKGVFEIDLFHAMDDRGVFVKTLHKATLEKSGLKSDFQESFYSTNNAGVIRGMHFQHPPMDHAKIVYCTSGKLTDVILDIRLGSPTYGKSICVELTGSNYKAVYMPSGVAHGFEVLEDNTTMVYLTSTMHDSESDDGIRYDSFGFEWTNSSPLMSARDLDFKSLEDFESPFIY